MIKNRKLLVVTISILAITPFLTQTMNYSLGITKEGPLGVLQFVKEGPAVAETGDWAEYGWINVPEYNDRVLVKVTVNEDMGGWYKVEYPDKNNSYKILPRGLFYWENIDTVKHQPRGREFKFHKGNYSNKQAGTWTPEADEPIHPSKMVAKQFSGKNMNAWYRHGGG